MRGSVSEIAAKASELVGRQLKVELRVEPAGKPEARARPAGAAAEDDPVAIVEGAPNAFNGIQRKLGFEDAMKAAGARVVSSQSGFWETDQANRVAAAVRLPRAGPPRRQRGRLPQATPWEIQPLLQPARHRRSEQG